MALSSLLSIVVALFPISEIALAIFRRASRDTTSPQDRGSMWAIWVVITLSVVGSILAQRSTIGRLAIPLSVLNPVALTILLLGLGIRWVAIITLGKYFTVNVAIASDHRIVQDGLYRLVRHPSYTGLLLAFFGMGLAFQSWLSLLILMVPITTALYVRIAIEERALHSAFGHEYEAYCSHTWRLIPWVL